MKKVFILKKEHIFPNFWIFTNLNEKIWQKKLNEISKFLKKEEISVICDNEHYLYFKKQGIECKAFGDYIEKYENRYKEAIEYSRNILKKLGIGDEAYLVEEELAYILINYLDNINILVKIKKKENPDKVYCLNSFFGDFVQTVFSNRVKKISGFKFFQLIAKKFTGKFSFKTRFYNLPIINRIEFVKTNTKKPEKSKKTKKRFLILGFDALYYGRIDNLVQEIIKQGKEEVIVLTTNRDTQDKLARQKIKFISFGDYLEKEYLEEVNKRSKEYIRKFKSYKKDRIFVELFKYNQQNFFSLFECDLTYFLKYRIPWVILYYKCYQNLYKKAQVDYVVAIDDRIPESRSGFVVAKKLGIKNMIVQSGVAEDNVGRGFVPLTADKISVWGQDVKKYLMNFGIEKNKIAVTGSLRLEKPRVKLQKKEVYKKLGLKNKNPLIIVAAQQFGGDFGETEKEIFLRACIEVAKKIPKKNFIIKLHPRETPDIHISLINELKPKNVKIVKEPNINELINNSEGLITIFSTSIIEAMLLGKSSISLNLAGRPNIVPFSKYDSIIYIKDKQSLKNAIYSLKDKNLKKGVKKFLKNYCYKVDGKSSQRVLNILRKKWD